MSVAVKAAAVLWRLALAALFAILAWQVWQLRAAPAWIALQLERQGDATRAAALAAIDNARGDLAPRLDRLIGLSDRRIADLTARLDRQLTAANAFIAEVARLRSDLDSLLPPVRNTLDAASETADLLGRCATQDTLTGEWSGNPDCLANRAIPALRNLEHMAAAGERMAAAVEKETPATAASVRAASQSAATIAATFEKEAPATAAAVRGTSQSVATIAATYARPAGWIKGVLFTVARVAGKWFGF